MGGSGCPSVHHSGTGCLSQGGRPTGASEGSSAPGSRLTRRMLMPGHEYCPGGRSGRVPCASVSPLAHGVLCVFGGPSSPALNLYEFFSRSFLRREVSFLQALVRASPWSPCRQEAGHGDDGDGRERPSGPAGPALASAHPEGWSVRASFGVQPWWVLWGPLGALGADGCCGPGLTGCSQQPLFSPRRDLSMNNLTELPPGRFHHLRFLEEL